MKDDGQRLGVIKFGRQLIESEDLDPLYIALWESNVNHGQLCKWLVCYWCYYHAGLCCWVSEQKDFFGTMLRIAKGGTQYPRGTERRHFRGDLAVSSIRSLGKHFVNASSIVSWLVKAGPGAKAIAKRVKTLRGFGEWISWKVPDMLERLELGVIDFVDGDLCWMFKSSQQGAKEVVRAHNLVGVVGAHRYLIRHLGYLKAPPLYDRPINVQETETIFCKWHSHLGGHYPVGKDTVEIQEGLQRWESGLLGQKMLRVLGRLEARKGFRVKD